MSSIAIEVSGLSKRFGPVVAVEDLSFAVGAGTVTALLGGNGAGKTTTMGMILGLVTPTTGRIAVLGRQMPQQRYEVLPRLNFSSPYVDLPHRLTARQNLTVYAHLYGLRGIRQRLEVLAEEFDLADLMHRTTGTLSAGQKTRLALAKALINEPDVLLLDEPTASLDPESADWIRRYLQDYQRRTGATILLASHNMTEVERLAHDVIMLRRGVIVDQDAPDRLIARYGRRNLEEVFLDIARGGGPGTEETAA
jgi:ABC-2 type transport system ATP-binding protein